MSPANVVNPLNIIGIGEILRNPKYESYFSGCELAGIATIRQIAGTDPGFKSAFALHLYSGIGDGKEENDQLSKVLKRYDIRPRLQHVPGTVLGTSQTVREELEGSAGRFSQKRLYSAARQMLRPEITKQEDIDFIANEADIILFSNVTLAVLRDFPEQKKILINALEAAKSRGATLYFDTNVRPILYVCEKDKATDAPSLTVEEYEVARQLTVEGISLANVILPSMGDLRDLFGPGTPSAGRFLGTGKVHIETPGDAVDFLRTLGVREAAITDAGDAITVMHNDLVSSVKPTMPDPKRRMPVGDCFNGGYIYARLQHQSPAEAAQFGSTVVARIAESPHDGHTSFSKAAYPGGNRTGVVKELPDFEYNESSDKHVIYISNSTLIL